MSDRISKCIACDSSNFKYYAENTTLKVPIHICQECQLHVAGESQEQLDNIVKEFYKQDFWDIERDRELNDEHDDQYSIGRKKLFSSQIKYIQKHISKNSKILEIGSGHGEALIQFEKLNYNVTGIEPDSQNVENLKKILKKSKIIQSNIEEFDMDQKFDVIWMSHVFEHLSNPISFLNKIKSKMEKNGILFIEVPNVTKKKDYRTFTFAPHAYNYSGLALQNILEKTGYEIISCDYFGPPTKFHGALNKFYKKFKKTNFYQYYPKILFDSFTGEDLRIISKLS
jgi:2-polyprenyl-3-methyl-5-hydroxy-6-metoxy-1,4-benzoquinol methylase